MRREVLDPHPGRMLKPLRRHATEKHQFVALLEHQRVPKQQQHLGNDPAVRHCVARLALAPRRDRMIPRADTGIAALVEGEPAAHLRMIEMQIQRVRGGGSIAGEQTLVRARQREVTPA